MKDAINWDYGSGSPEQTSKQGLGDRIEANLGAHQSLSFLPQPRAVGRCQGSVPWLVKVQGPLVFSLEPLPNSAASHGSGLVIQNRA